MLSLFFMIAAVAASCNSATPVAPAADSVVGRVWMHVDGPWESPPPEAELNERTAPVTLLRFERGGAFSMMHCYVIEQDGKLTISNGDGQAISLGSWSENGSTLEVAYRLVYETVQPVGGRTYPGPEIKVTATVDGRSLLFGRSLFDEAKRLDVRRYDQFIAPERRCGNDWSSVVLSALCDSYGRQLRESQTVAVIETTQPIFDFDALLYVNHVEVTPDSARRAQELEQQARSRFVTQPLHVAEGACRFEALPAQARFRDVIQVELSSPVVDPFDGSTGVFVRESAGGRLGATWMWVSLRRDPAGQWCVGSISVLSTQDG